jgi:hypothetical protein
MISSYHTVAHVVVSLKKQAQQLGCDITHQPSYQTWQLKVVTTTTWV